MLLSVTIFSLVVLFKSKEHLFGIIVMTAVVSFLIIVMFGYLHTLTQIDSESKLIFTNSDEKLETPWDYIYFSSSAFYGNAIGDIQPLGYNKLLMQIESGLSFIFHYILII